MADTIFGWDASHHDWGRGSMDIAAAVRAGIQFMTHKVGEADNFTDDRYDDFYRRARAAGVGLVGAYYVNHPGDQNSQADRFLALLDARGPGWRDGPFLLQVDAEKFDYMDRAPNLAEIRAFCDRLTARTGGRFRPIVYAPKWLYGDKLKGLPYALWASNYGNNPTGAYRSLYPGDTSSRWVAYSGQTPVILQYGSRTTIATQKTCDANAFRGSLAELIALTGGDNDMQLSDPIKYVQGPEASYSQDATTVGTLMGQTLYYVLATRNKVAADAAADKARDEAILALLKGASGGSVDVLPVLERINAVRDEVLAKLEAEFTALQVERDELAARLAEALAPDTE